MKTSNFTRNVFFSIARCALGLGLLAAWGQAQNPVLKTAAIRPFHIDIPETALTDLRRRIAATQWPERETVGDATRLDIHFIHVALKTCERFADRDHARVARADH